MKGECNCSFAFTKIVMKVYTKTGDKGTTSLIGERTTKDDIRVDAYGTIDTLNSHLNYAMTLSDEYNACLIRISQYLFTVSHDLSQTDASKYKVDDREIIWLEGMIDTLTKSLDQFDHFVLPGGTSFAAYIHICRTICRTCERKIVSAAKSYDVNEFVLTYINRLSDFLYILACYDNHESNVELIPVKM